MKKLFYLFACVAAGVAAVAFTGCNDNKEEPASEIIVQSDVNVAVDKTGGPQVIKFTTNYDWTIKVTTDPAGGTWYDMGTTATSGKAGSVSLNITVNPNDTELERTLIVSIATVKEPSLPKQVKLVQAANTDPKDVTVQIPNAASLIIHDRNLGATKIGELGTYYTYAEALTACPSGYHLFTMDEYLDMTYYNDVFPTKDALKDGALKFPVTGGYKDGDKMEEATVGYYWLDGAEYGVASTDEYGYAAETRDAGGFLLAPFYPDYKVAWKMQVRCVTDVK